MLVFRGVNLYVVCWCQSVYSLTITSLPTRGAPVRVDLFEEVDGSMVNGSVGPRTPMNTPFTSRWVLSHLQPSILTSWDIQVEGHLQFHWLTNVPKVQDEDAMCLDLSEKTDAYDLAVDYPWRIHGTGTVTYIYQYKSTKCRYRKCSQSHGSYGFMRLRNSFVIGKIAWLSLHGDFSQGLFYRATTYPIIRWWWRRHRGWVFAASEIEGRDGVPILN